MLLPKVNFSNIPLSLETRMFYYFLIEFEWDWKEIFKKIHPETRNIYEIKNKKERIKFLKKYISTYWKKERLIINRKKKIIQKSWKIIEIDYLKTLSEVVNTNWSRNKNIKAMISINPICPRFLNNWSFSFFYKYKGESAIEIIMHEICHFLYFKKWQEIFPKSKKRTFDRPYIEWHLSEVSTPIILNDKRIQKILKKKAYFYSEHQKLKIGKKDVPQYFTEIYKKNINQKDGFEKFLKESYREIKINKKIFLEI